MDIKATFNGKSNCYISSLNQVNIHKWQHPLLNQATLNTCWNRRWYNTQKRWAKYQKGRQRKLAGTTVDDMNKNSGNSCYCTINKWFFPQFRKSRSNTSQILSNQLMVTTQFLVTSKVELQEWLDSLQQKFDTRNLRSWKHCAAVITFYNWTAQCCKSYYCISQVTSVLHAMFCSNHKCPRKTQLLAR